jgi:membrane fusion protein, multidrug efflux system
MADPTPEVALLQAEASEPAAPEPAAAERAAPEPAAAERAAPEPASDAAQDSDTATPRAHRRRRWPWVVLAAVVLVVVVLVVVRATKKAPPKPPPSPVAVTSATAVTSDLPVHVDAIGTVTPLATATITAQVTAQITNVSYLEGELVQRGAPLFELDKRPFRAVLMQTEGALRRDEQVLAQAKMDLDRYRAAWAKNAIAKQQLDDQELLVKQDAGLVENDRGAVDAARLNVEFCSITSPISGRVGLRLVDPGNLVNTAAGTPLAVVTQLQPISVIFAISEDQLVALWQRPDHGAGARVELFDRARAHQLASGALTTLDNQIDTTTGTVRARATFDNGNGALFPNQFVNAQILVDTLHDVITLPSQAIQRDGEKAFVFAIADGHAHVQAVQVGTSDGDRTQVTGLAAGTLVATSSFDKLHDGALVAVQAPHAQPPSPVAPGSGGNGPSASL